MSEMNLSVERIRAAQGSCTPLSSLSKRERERAGWCSVHQGSPRYPPDMEPWNCGSRILHPDGPQRKRRLLCREPGTQGSRVRNPQREACRAPERVCVCVWVCPCLSLRPPLPVETVICQLRDQWGWFWDPSSRPMALCVVCQLEAGWELPFGWCCMGCSPCPSAAVCLTPHAPALTALCPPPFCSPQPAGWATASTA